MHKALFLDRDGVINFDYGYVHKIDQFDFIPGIFEIGRKAISHGYKIIVITNQAGIGRGLYSETDFLILSEWMCGVFLQEGIEIKKVYFSPYHPTAGIGKYRADDYSRKPRPGMILDAKKEFNIDLQKSILVGDNQTDIDAGVSAGVGINLLYSPKYMGEEKLKVGKLIDTLNYFD